MPTFRTSNGLMWRCEKVKSTPLAMAFGASHALHTIFYLLLQTHVPAESGTHNLQSRTKLMCKAAADWAGQSNKSSARLRLFPIVATQQHAETV